MCGRFTLRTQPAEFWPADQLSLFQPRFNIAPSQEVPTVRLVGGNLQLALVRWGLVPWWAKDTKIGFRLINARGETVSEKPSFRDAFKRRRCIVVADGYYEWKTIGKVKQPFFFQMQDERPFAFAGLWETWRGGPGATNQTPLETCTIVTTEANELAAAVHDRMPVILSEEHQKRWLDPEFGGPDAAGLLRSYAANAMQMYPVSRFVNKATNESPECLERVSLADTCPES